MKVSVFLCLSFAFSNSNLNVSLRKELIVQFLVLFLIITLIKMHKSEIKRGILVSFLISSLLTFPRLFNLDMDSVYSIFGHSIYLFFLNLFFWILATYFVKSKANKIVKIGVFLLTSGIISILYHFVIILFYKNYDLLFSYNPIVKDLNLKQQVVFLFLRGLSFSGFVYFVYYYLNLLQERQNAIVEIETLKKEKLEAQLNSLKQQISPHFLFNSLSTLRTIVTDDNSKNYILKLSNVFRYLLSFNENNLTTLQEELEFVKSYLYILKERFEDSLDVSIEVDENVLNKMLPPLSLQLLIENAIKHNVLSLEEPLQIKVYNEGETMLVVSNNLQPKLSTEASTGKGLENISTRYKLLSNQTIVITNNSKVFEVKLPLLTNKIDDDRA